MTRTQRRQLDRRIAERLAALGEAPYRRPQNISEGETTIESGPGVEKPPEPKARWIFPSIGLFRAASMAHAFVKAASGQDRSHLRLVTLRAGSSKPKPAEFVANVDALSHGMDTYVDHLIRSGLVRPLISAIHLRLDTSSGAVLFDPHLHGVWHVERPDLEKVRRYLAERFSDVWIDEDPVRNLRRGAFYVCSGTIDYAHLPDWPDEALRAVWKMPRRRMIRRAGWAAGAVVDAGASTAVRAASKPRRPPVKGFPGQNPTKPVAVSQGHQEAAQAPTAPAVPRKRQRAFSSTVRALPPESPQLISTALPSPSVNQLHLVLAVLRWCIEEGALVTLARISRQFEVSENIVTEAVTIVERYLEAPLFFPSDHSPWTPTDAGRDFADRGTPIMQALDFLAVDIGAPARLARQSWYVAFRKGMSEIP